MEERMIQKMKKFRKKHLAANASESGTNKTESAGNRSSSQRNMSNDTYSFIPDLGACTCLDVNGNFVRSTESGSISRIPCGHSDCQAPYILLFTRKNSTFAGQSKMPKEINQQTKQQNRARRKSNSDPDPDLEIQCDPRQNLPRAQSDVTSVMISTLLNAWRN